MSRGACSSWRIARAVTGRLRAHPYARYQRDASIGCHLCNDLRAGLRAFTIRNRARALMEYEWQLRKLARQLDDARALTWSADLSDSFGRSQIEIRSILAALARETDSAVDTAHRSNLDAHRSNLDGSRSGEFAAPIEGDWPYLAF
jgi:hypothetical protein